MTAGKIILQSAPREGNKPEWKRTDKMIGMKVWVREFPMPASKKWEQKTYS